MLVGKEAGSNDPKHPTDVELDKFGNLYFCDKGTDEINSIDKAKLTELTEASYKVEYNNSLSPTLEEPVSLFIEDEYLYWVNNKDGTDNGKLFINNLKLQFIRHSQNSLSGESHFNLSRSKK